MALEHLEIDQAETAVVARLAGEVDLSNAGSITDQLLDAMDNAATRLVLDLSGTDYLDSSGVRMIFELAHRLRTRRQELRIVVPDDSNVKRVLVLTEVERMVPMATSVEDAVGR
jgi:anti-anti-sigma factor